MKYSAIILAGGTGQRFGGRKQDELLDGKPLWKFLKDKVEPHFEETIVVGKDIPGGMTRKKSVENGLNKAKGKYVVIFESARPLITDEQIIEIKKAVQEYNSVSFYWHTINTQMFRKQAYMREGLIQLQTPQAFNRYLLLRCHQRWPDRAEFTDDTKLMFMRYGTKPKLLLGGNNLVKVTYPEDMDMIKALWEYKKKSS